MTAINHQQFMDFKSNNNTLKLTLIWLILLFISLSPWLMLGNDFVYAKILTDLLALSIVLFLKVSLKVVIYPKENIVEYYCMRLWGCRQRVSIDIKEASFKLETKNNRGNDLWNLIIIDNENKNNKISIMQISDGFDGQQIQDIYYALNKVAGN